MTSLLVIARQPEITAFFHQNAFTRAFEITVLNFHKISASSFPARTDLILVSEEDFRDGKVKKWMDSKTLKWLPKVLISQQKENPPDPGDLIHFKCLSHVHLSQPIDTILKTLQKATLGTLPIGAREVMGNWVTFHFSSKEKILESVQSFLEIMLEYSGLPSSKVESLGFGIHELLLNALEHGNEYDPQKKINVSYVLFLEKIVIKIEDQGQGFLHTHTSNPLSNPEATAQQRSKEGKRPGGYGIAVAKEFVDQIEYNDKGNLLVLTKSLD